MDGVTVLRVGTQVVVRLGGDVDDTKADRLSAALDEIHELVLTRVVIDCSAATGISGAGLLFLGVARERWRARVLDLPPELREALSPPRTS